jgi:lysophospholipase L1-like esterase
MITILRKTAWVAFVGAAGIGSAEIVARVDDAIRSGAPIMSSPSSTDLTMHDGLGTRGRPYARYQKWRLNSAGFRGQEISLVPRRDCTRVAVMGASETFGYAESPGKEYPLQLEDSLNRSGCYEVMNTAVTGLPLTGQVQLWENWVSRFQPNVVVIYASPAFYLSNDAPHFAELHHDVKATPLESDPFALRLLARLKDRVEYPAFMQRRRLDRKISNAISGQPQGWIFDKVPAERVALFRQHLDSLVTTIKARGAVPVLVTHAMRFGGEVDAQDRVLLRSWRQFTPRATEDVLMRFERETAKVVRELAAERGVPVADVAAQMTGHEKWFADFTHFNDEGAGVIAHCIAETIQNARPAPSVVLSAVP